MRPRIAVNCNVKRGLRKRGDGRLLALNPEYARCIVRAGGLPLVLPPLAQDGRPDFEAIEAALDGVDAVVLTGGDDMHPRAYGQDVHPRAELLDVERDASDLALVSAALRRDLPILGVCGGMQLLDVALGGSLHQHLPDAGFASLHPVHRDPDAAAIEHEVAPLGGSRLAEIAGAAPMSTNSRHHQAVDRVGAGLAVSARAADGVIEAIELEGDRFALGVQWHPEEHEGDERQQAIFRALVAEARRRAR